MASAAFRDDYRPEARSAEGGADMVRRLLTQSARTRSGAARVSNPILGRAEPRHEEREARSTVADDVARLQAELRVLTAALRAEQEEVAALRAELEHATTQAATQVSPVNDIRGDRDRWANLVERLLFSER